MAYNSRKFCKRIKVFLVICCFVLPLYFIYSHSLVKEGALCANKACSCESCVSDRGISHWFDVRFNSSIQPQLTSSNEKIPQDILLWWLGLQSRHPRMRMMYSRLFETMPKFNSVENSRSCHCRRCAIVGNSGNLKGSSYGQLIDSQDYVIRMNRAVTKGYELDVGKKTTHHFMYPESAKDLGANVHLVLVPFKPLDLLWLDNVLLNRNFFLSSSFIQSSSSMSMTNGLSIMGSTHPLGCWLLSLGFTSVISYRYLAMVGTGKATGTTIGKIIG
ncbi:CMP-N-acetylneuraminate-beta-galactosamide-alpha-2,3-sialyltransferase 2-like isoform X3 [Chiloscyllium plagiosum]|uniref:CMP-N-acetylneuraminate-beta-galactosamide- alpha-2,3-sialyltransferase 2-like isoform X3 n=1 Tax=Chiloscyllium plagiosum TaxID=36176 RepID=UPI001CB851F2|nr:CMP-N-acetylneuraminate-beta-galactosamide-alpha-2,3-sialyltransferase 2-like isoform X3 [Chiloscyllium plagiosum]